MEIEDHARIELHPETHITWGYFDLLFSGHYAQMVLTMLETLDAPKEGYWLAMCNNLRVNPLVNPKSYHYVVDLVLLRPLMASGRVIHLLRPRPQESFEQARVAFQRGGGEVVDSFSVTISVNRRSILPTPLLAVPVYTGFSTPN